MSLPFFFRFQSSNAKKASPHRKSRPGDLAVGQDAHVMAGLYGYGYSSPDNELGHRLVCKLSEEEMGRRQGLHEHNAIGTVGS